MRHEHTFYKYLNKKDKVVGADEVDVKPSYLAELLLVSHFRIASN